MKTFTAFAKILGKSPARSLREKVELLDTKPIGVGIFEVDEVTELWEIGIYFDQNPDIAGLALLEILYGVKFVFSKLDKFDWVSQVRRELTPIRSGRYMVYGGHDKDKVSINQFPLEIEAAMAFGTGHHATTQLCLMSFSYLLKIRVAFVNVVDIGCGTGILSMAAAAVKVKNIVACDLDPIAIETCKINFKKNNHASRILAVRSNGFINPIFQVLGPFDLIFANILAKPLKNMVKEVRKFQKPGGFIILSGILEKQALGVEIIYKAHGYKRVKIFNLLGWSALVMRYNMHSKS